SAGRYLLTAADDGIVGNGGRIQWRRLEQTPEPRLKARGCRESPSRSPSRGFGLRSLPPEITRNRGRSEGALRPRGMGTAAPRALADGKYLRQAGAALTVGQCLHRAVAARHEAVRATQRTGELGRGGKAIVQGHDVGFDRAVAGLDGAHPFVAAQPR